MDKNTKEELLKINGDLEGRVKDWSAEDEKKRRTLSQFLGSYESGYSYSNSRIVKVLSWAEIYFEMGKVIEQKNQRRFSEEINILTERVNHKEKL